MMMPPLMMVKEDYFTGSARSRIIRWHRVHHPSNPNSICSTASEVGCATPYWHRVTFALLQIRIILTYAVGEA